MTTIHLFFPLFDSSFKSSFFNLSFSFFYLSRFRKDGCLLGAHFELDLRRRRRQECRLREQETKDLASLSHSCADKRVGPSDLRGGSKGKYHSDLISHSRFAVLAVVLGFIDDEKLIPPYEF